MLLTATSHIIELTTATSVSTDWTIHAADHTSTTFTPVSDQGNIASATTTTIVAAPGASTQRQVKMITIRNRSTTDSQTVIVKKDVSGTEYHLTSPVILQPGESLAYTDTTGWRLSDANGRQKLSTSVISGSSNRPVSYFKVGTTGEAAGRTHTVAQSDGQPGPWAVGTPGLAGRTTDGTTAADAGCLPIATPPTGANYITGWTAFSQIACVPQLWDFLWVNSGITVTTTTAQTVNSVAFPARDLNGSANGEGVHVGIYVSVSTGVSAVTNTTLQYTNSAGTASRTGTMASFPTTAQTGTIVWFELQGGDSGVQSIQSVTLGTTYTSGTIHLLAAVPLAACSVNTSGQSSIAPIDPSAGVRLYTGACVHMAFIESAASGNNQSGVVQITNR